MSNSKRQRTVDVVATFVALMHAHERGELATAAEARAELERLGVVVRFPRPKVSRRKGGNRNA